MDLPRSLAPWGPFLSIFPRDLALSLGPVLQRLSSALGPLKVRRSSGEGEADGFDGLARKGGYERLLASEWLLADEEPGEFLRRAAMGEHLFLRINHPAPGGSRASVAIFDAGPAQLGSPRIAQLAALIVLARRAETAGVRFAWGILQEPAAPLFPEVMEAGVLRLLQARTPHEATDAQVQAWRDRVRGWKELDDLWIIGPPRLGAMPATRGASVLQVRDVLDLDGRQVAVKVRRGPGAPLGEVSLELPDNASCARLLRDPFAASAAAPRRLARRLIPVSNLLFAASASTLFARAAGGGVVGFPLPNSPRAEAGKPRHYDPGSGALPVAVGVAGKVVVAVTAEDGVLRRWSFPKRGGASPSRDNPAAEPSPPAPLPSPTLPIPGRGEKFGMEQEVAERASLLVAKVLPSPGGGWKGDGRGAGGEGPAAALQPLFQVGSHTFVVDSCGALFQLADTPPGREPVRIAERVAAAAMVARLVVFVEPAAADRRARIATVTGSALPATAVELEGPGEAAFFGYGGRIAHPEFGLAAVEHEGGAWEVLSARGRPFLTPFAGTRVVGVARDAQRGEPGLLLLEEDRRTLVLAGLNWTRKLPPASFEIAQVAASAAGPLVAYTTVSGDLAVFSLDHEAPLLRLFPEDAP